MRLTIVAVVTLLASAPLAAQQAGTPPDTAPPSPGVICAEREGRCDTGAVKGEKCERASEVPCTDPPPVRTACVDRNRDGKCDAPTKNRGANAAAGVGGVITSIWVNNVPKEKGGQRGEREPRPNRPGAP
jgi:hypothetical protein